LFNSKLNGRKLGFNTHLKQEKQEKHQNQFSTTGSIYDRTENWQKLDVIVVGSVVS